MPCWKVSCGRKVTPSSLFLRSGRTGLENCTALVLESQFCHVVVTIQRTVGLLAKFFGGKFRAGPHA